MHDDEKNITLDKAVDGLNQPPPSTPDNECLGGCLSVSVSRCGGSHPITTLRSVVTLVTLASSGQWSGQLRLRIWPGNLTTVSTPQQR